MCVPEYAALIKRNPRTVYYSIKAGKLAAAFRAGTSRRGRIIIIVQDEVQSKPSATTQQDERIWPLSLWAGYMGLSTRRVQQLAKAGRIKGVIDVNPRIRLIHVLKASIEPNFNFTRRTTGHPIGRSKPLRGEPGFIEKIA